MADLRAWLLARAAANRDSDRHAEADECEAIAREMPQVDCPRCADKDARIAHLEWQLSYTGITR